LCGHSSRANVHGFLYTPGGKITVYEDFALEPLLAASRVVACMQKSAVTGAQLDLLKKPAPVIGPNFVLFGAENLGAGSLHASFNRVNFPLRGQDPLRIGRTFGDSRVLDATRISGRYPFESP
jgi:hypothetical protein